MSSKTTNYNLTKPSADDFYDIEVQNGNMDIVDAELKRLNNEKAPSGHGLGDTTNSNRGVSFKSIMSKGCGFYQVDQSSDNPIGTNSWMSLLQTVRYKTPGSETGVQLVLSDANIEPRMWMRAMQLNVESEWVEMLHTGNISKYANARIKFGSYQGTGVSGSANPNTLSFDFDPKIVIIKLANSPENLSAWADEMVAIKNCSEAKADGISSGSIKRYTEYLTWDNNKLSWNIGQDNSPSLQLNASGHTYNYIAIG